MADPSRIDGDLTQLEQELAHLAPRPARLSEARLMYEAGRSAMQAEFGARRRGWTWPVATGAIMVLASVFALLWATGRNPDVVVRTIYVPANSEPGSIDDSEGKSSDNPKQPASAPSNKPLKMEQQGRPAEAPRPNLREAPAFAAWYESDVSTWPRQQGYLETRRIALVHGLDALPRLPVGGTGTAHEPATYQQLRREMLTGDGG